MNSRKRKRRKAIYQNIFIVFFVLVISLSGISYLLSRFYVNDFLKEKIISNFNSNNKKKFKLSIESLNVNLLRSYIVIKKAKVSVYQNQTCNFFSVYSVNFPVIEIKQIALWELINNNRLHAKELKLQFPEIVLAHCEKVNDTLVVNEISEFIDSLQFKQTINADRLNIMNADLKLKNYKSDTLLMLYENFNYLTDSVEFDLEVHNYLNNIKTLDDFNQAFKKLMLKNKSN